MTIFCKTYSKCFVWLETMLRSVIKFAKGDIRLLVVVDNPDEEKYVKQLVSGFKAAILQADLLWPEVKNLGGYDQAQWIKINLHRIQGLVGSEKNILIWDNDIFAIAPFHHSSFRAYDGKPIMWVTRWRQAKGDLSLIQANKERTAYIQWRLGLPEDGFDYMVCQPIWINLDVCRSAERFGRAIYADMESKLKGIADQSILGVVAKTWHPEVFDWRIVEPGKTWQGEYGEGAAISRRNWSWGDDPVKARTDWEKNCK